MGNNETMVVIVGGGPSGLAAAACLNLLRIENIILEREDCCASLWKKKSYDRLKLHLPKHLCELPHMPFPPASPTFVPKAAFIHYLDHYASHFRIHPNYCRSVESAVFDTVEARWRIVATNTLTNACETYVSQFMVVATGENSEGFIPEIPGLETFPAAQYIHSTQYQNGHKFSGDNNYTHVLVVGSGNSGMEIAYDLSNWGVKTSIVVRSPIHVLTKELASLGLWMIKYVPCKYVDALVLLLNRFIYGHFSAYGLTMPTKGPFFIKVETGQSPVIDVGTMAKIKKGEIEVVPSISNIEGSEITFVNGKRDCFDAIVFATGFKSTVWNWLKDDGKELFNEEGMPKKKFPHHWKGQNGLYCVGFASKGLLGISNDAKKIADDIINIISENK